MGLEFYCTNCRTEIMEANFNGCSKVICSKCKAIIKIKGKKDRYIIEIKRLLNPDTKRKREKSEPVIMHCPYCKNELTDIRTLNRYYKTCPKCKRPVIALIFKDRLIIKYTKEK